MSDYQPTTRKKGSARTEPLIENLAHKVDEHEIKLDAINRTIDNHQTLLVGIPDCPGLVLRVKTLETSMGVIEKALVRINIYMGIIVFFSSLVAASVAVFIWQIITHAVQIIH